MIQLIQFYFKTIGNVFPKAIANQAFKLFAKVRKKEIRKRELPFFEQAKKYNLPFNSGSLDCYAFGKPTKDIVVLVHGWDSNVGCMYQLATALAKEGKYCIGFNLPAHAFYKEKQSNIFICKEAFKTVLNNLPEYTHLSILSHSFGSVVTAYGLSELDVKIDKLVFQTSPNYLKDVFLEFKGLVALPNAVYAHLKNKAEAIINEDLDKLATETKLKGANFKHLYLFHDKYDKVIPFSKSEEIHNAISNSTLLPYEKVGHYRMLFNENIIAKTVEILMPI